MQIGNDMKIGILPMIFYGAVLFSHRIAGPLPKIYQVLREIGAGNFNVKITLRKSDELKELADAVNQMSSQLKERESKR
jgi:nitrate/nitrite-specific signal transduction histidine kinase